MSNHHKHCQQSSSSSFITILNENEINAANQMNLIKVPVCVQYHHSSPSLLSVSSFILILNGINANQMNLIKVPVLGSKGILGRHFNDKLGSVVKWLHHYQVVKYNEPEFGVRCQEHLKGNLEIFQTIGVCSHDLLVNSPSPFIFQKSRNLLGFQSKGCS